MIDAFTQYEISEKRSLDGLVGVFLVLGPILLALNGPLSSVRSLRLVNFALNVLPIALAVVLYVRVASTVSVIELAVLVVWTVFALQVSAVIGYFAFGGQSASYPGEVAELTNHVVLFLGTVAAVGGLCSAAAAQDRPLPKWLFVAAIPIGQLLVYAVYAAV